jgi:signal transduction histidine kinase
MLADLARDGSIRDREVRMRRRDGTHFTVSLNVEPIEWNGKTARLASLRDITGTKRSDEQLREQAAQLRELSARLAHSAEAERAEFARMLHDAVGQNLTGLSFQLHALLDGKAPASDARVRERLLDCLSMVSYMADASRELSDVMRPSELDDYGLEVAIRSYGDRFGSRTGLAIRYRVAEPAGPRLPHEVEIAIFRVVQEALDNVARHAKAGEVVISIDALPGRCRLEVSDDGAGFDPMAVRGGGDRKPYGILLMQRRAEAVGATCRVESRPGHGTRVIVEVPR